jgi:hypothetical protein
MIPDGFWGKKIDLQGDLVAGCSHVSTHSPGAQVMPSKFIDIWEHIKLLITPYVHLW